MVTVDPAFVPLLIGLITGSAAGGLSAFLGWIKDGKQFDNKLFVYGIVVGIITGLGSAMLYMSDLENAATASALLKVLVSIITAVLAADTIRTAFTGAIHAREQQTTSGTT